MFKTLALLLALSGSVDAQVSGHRTDFLTLDGKHDMLGYAALSSDRRADIRASLRDRAYTHLYLYVIAENDIGLGYFNYYEKSDVYRSRLQEVRQEGLEPVVWLAPDDAPVFHRDSAETLPTIWNTFIPAVDDLVSAYVLGLELGEYWSSSEIRELGLHLNSLTDRPIYVHYNSGQLGEVYESWVDGILYQYLPPRTPESVRRETEQHAPRVQAAGKLFIAGEYAYMVPEHSAMELGATAVRAGADGFANGGPRTAAVPALSGTGSVLLMSVLLVFGVLVLRRRPLQPAARERRA